MTVSTLIKDCSDLIPCEYVPSVVISIKWYIFINTNPSYPLYTLSKSNYYHYVIYSNAKPPIRIEFSVDWTMI